VSAPEQIVDAHHHLWDLEACHYPWLMARGERRFFGDPTPIQKDYLLGDFHADIGALPVRASVHVQVGVTPDQAVAETEWLQAVADSAGSRGMPQAIVGFCDLRAPDAEDILNAHQQYGNCRGVRQIVGRAPGEDARAGTGALLRDPAWQRGLGLLARRGLSFDLQLTPWQMTAAAAALDGVGDLRVALCHTGSPWDQSAAGFRYWRRGMTALAALPNVHCKLSGFGMFDPDWTAESIRPFVLTAIELFSPARCMFGSNFPVDKLYRSYAEVWEAIEATTRELNEAERQLVHAGTACAFYRIGPPEP